MESTDELKRLLEEKKELERRIHLLTTGALIHDTVKLDHIGFAGKFQKGKWALFFKYAHTVNTGHSGVPEARTKWQPIVNGETFDEVIGKIPDVIKALTDLYEEAAGNGTGA